MLFQQPTGEFLAQGPSSLLTLGERDQFVWSRAGKHLIKSGNRLLDPLPPQLTAFRRAEKLGTVHGRYSRQES